jgi:hypothetical protein
MVSSLRSRTWVSVRHHSSCDTFGDSPLTCRLHCFDPYGPAGYPPTSKPPSSAIPTYHWTLQPHMLTETSRPFPSRPFLSPPRHAVSPAPKTVAPVSDVDTTAPPAPAAAPTTDQPPDVTPHHTSAGITGVSDPWRTVAPFPAPTNDKKTSSADFNGGARLHYNLGRTSCSLTPPNVPVSPRSVVPRH